MVLLACLCSGQHLIAGLTNRTLRELIAGIIPACSRSQMTYDLRRKGLISRVPKSQRYEVTDFGRNRRPPPLAHHWHACERALDQRMAAAHIMT